MTAYPLKLDFMFGAVIQKLLPQVAIQCLAALPTLPPASTPALWYSRLHRGDEILGIRVECHQTRSLERPQARNGGHQLHAIVGREAVTARQFLSVLLVKEHDPIATRARVPEARAVRIDRDRFGCWLLQWTHWRECYDSQRRLEIPGRTTASPPVGFPRLTPS